MDVADVILVASLPLLVLLSALSSLSETVFFGLSQSDRIWLRRERPASARIVDELLSHPRQLLITVLLANMTINTLYFVSTSVLLMRLSESLLVSAAISVATLILLVLCGEILPKLVANTARRRLVGPAARAVLPVHLLLAPLRAILEKGVVAPLARLIGGGEASGLSVDELDAALEVAGRLGQIDATARGVLARVVRLGAVRVRDVMTPRVDVVAVREDATREIVAAEAARAGLTRLLVHRGDLDEIAGVVDVRAMLLDPRGDATPLAAHVRTPLFVPAVASVQQLFELFRDEGRQIAVVVDEYGGTEGVASLEDAIEEIVGDIAAPDEAPVPPPERLPGGRWRVSGEMPAGEFARRFRLEIGSDAPATAGGLVLEKLEREPHRGDRVELEGMRVEVESVQRGRIRQLLVDRGPEAES
ncbi:MAG: HlyC/CorC family transporter [Phycisphaerae bacterium]|nr:HlyC/CorC family transporter [Phycisphaerae bacterium]